MEKGTKTKGDSFEIVKYQTRNGVDVTLDFEVIKKYLVRGKPEFVSPQEMVFFMGICKEKGLNPVAQDCYLVKYTESDPAAIITSIEFLRARARGQKDCQGWECGIIIQRDDEIIKTHGLILEDDELLGGWFCGQPKGWLKPLEWEVPLKSFIRRKKDGSLTAFWKKEKQPFMIAKVAEAQGLRKLWPADLSHLYEEAEISPGLTGPAETEGQKEKVSIDMISEEEKQFWTRVKQTKGLSKKRVQEYLSKYSETMDVPMARLISEAMKAWDDFVEDFGKWSETTTEKPKKQGKREKKEEGKGTPTGDEKKAPPEANTKAEPGERGQSQPTENYKALLHQINDKVIPPEGREAVDPLEILPKQMSADQANELLHYLIKDLTQQGREACELTEFVQKVNEVCKK